MKTSFHLKRWAGWVSRSEVEGSGDQFSESLMVSDTPDVSVIPPMLRRRLNFLGKACAAQVLRVVSDNQQVPLVYCSRHGDIERTLSVLEELAEDKLVSPMQFSLAVHNAICGVLSIQLGNRSAVSALVSDNGGVVPVLLEAMGLLAENRADSILCLISDLPLPEVYRDENTPPDFSYAVSFVLSKSEGSRFSLSPVSDGDSSNASSDCPPVALIEYLDSASIPHMDIVENGCLWRLERV